MSGRFGFWRRRASDSATRGKRLHLRHQAMGRSSDPKDALLEEVLTRSFLEPMSKTYFDENAGRFVVVELKPTRDEVER